MKTKIENLQKQLDELRAEFEESQKPEIDFSILNDEDVFYLKSKAGHEYTFTGRNPFSEKVILLS